MSLRLEVSSSKRLFKILITFLSACFIGILVAFITLVFVKTVSGAENFRIDFRKEFEALSFALFSYQAVLLFAGMVILIIIRRALKIRSWHGPADVIHAAHSKITLLTVKTGIATIVSVFVSVL